MLKKLGTLLRWLVMPFVALLLIFEEWGWEPLAALMRRLSRLPFWAWLERKIAALPRWQALPVLLVPAALLFPIKLLALAFLHQGQVAVGMGILVAAKLIGTALVARLFQLTEPALMQFAWFARWYPRWKAWKDQLMHRLRSSSVWQAGKRIKISLRRNVQRLWRRLAGR
jgi:hypothetical protein